MVIEKLPVNFKDDVIDTSINDKRRYNLITNSDGTTSLEDVTTYEQIGSNFGAEQVNQTNSAVNELIENSELLSNGGEKVKVAEEADKLSSARKINGVDFDGTKDIMIEDDTKLPLDKDFILLNNETLTFVSRVVMIEDEKITADSIADVYFTSDTIDIAEEASISVETQTGRCVLTAIKEPEGTVKASIHIRVV